MPIIEAFGPTPERAAQPAAAAYATPSRAARERRPSARHARDAGPMCAMAGTHVYFYLFAQRVERRAERPGSPQAANHHHSLATGGDRSDREPPRGGIGKLPSGSGESWTLSSWCVRSLRTQQRALVKCQNFLDTVWGVGSPFGSISWMSVTFVFGQFKLADLIVFPVGLCIVSLWRV